MRKTVLLIDDDKDEHELFCEALKKYDSHIHCLTAYSWEQGYNILKETPPDFIFLDFNMPQTNGIECLTKIKKNPLLKHIPVHMYSASHVTETIKNLALEIGALAWIKKPIEFKEYQRIFSGMYSGRD